MNKKSLLPLLLVSAALLSGCDKKKEEAPRVEPVAAKPVVAPAAVAQPSASEQVKEAAKDAVEATKAAGEQVVEQAKAAMKDAGVDAKAASDAAVKEVKAAAASASESLKDATRDVKTEANSLLSQLKSSAAATPAAGASAEKSADFDVKGLVEKVTASAKELLEDSSVSTALKDQLKKLSDSVVSSNDAEATSALSKIVALKPSEAQLATVKELQSNLAVLVLSRDFDANDPASGGAIRQTIEAIKTKDTSAAVAGLQKIYTSAKPTDAQKQLVSNLLSSYDAKLAGVSDSIEKAGSVLKGFGL